MPALTEKDKDLFMIGGFILAAGGLLFFLIGKGGITNAATSASLPTLAGSAGSSGAIGLSPAANYPVSDLGLPELPAVSFIPQTNFTLNDLGQSFTSSDAIKQLLAAIAGIGGGGAGCCVTSPSMPYTEMGYTPPFVNNVAPLPTAYQTVYQPENAVATSYPIATTKTASSFFGIPTFSGSSFGFGIPAL